MRRTLARFLLRRAGWRTAGTVPRTGVLVGAPHTSNWDFLLAVLFLWEQDVPPRVLVKSELFRGPLGWVLRRIGAVPIDRRHPSGVVRRLVADARGDEPFVVALAPEGTRARADGWKSGFYRIASAAQLPIALGYVDGPTRTVGCGPVVVPSGDVAADMDAVRAFYADKRGIHPERRSEPRLREETPRAPA